MAKGAPTGIEGDILIWVFLDNYIGLNLMQEKFSVQTLDNNKDSLWYNMIENDFMQTKI